MLLAGFVVIEARSAHALMPLRIFADRSRSGAYLIMLLIGTALFGLFFFLTIFVQDVLGYSAVKTGVAFLPIAVAIVVVAVVAGQVIARTGARPLILSGTAITSGGMYWFSRLGVHGTYAGGLLGPMLVTGAPPGDAARENALSLREPAAKPLTYTQIPPRDQPQQPLVLTEPGDHPGSERHRGLGITAKLAEKAPLQRNQRGYVHQQAAGPADSRVKRLIGPARGRSLSRIEQRLHRLQLATVGRQERLRQQQPGPGPDKLTGQRRNPALNRRTFAAQVENRVEVLLDQAGGPEHVPGGCRVLDGVVGEPVPGVPGSGVAVQLRHQAGLFLLQAGAEQVGEQVVVAPPAAELIQRHQEQPRLFHLLQ